MQERNDAHAAELKREKDAVTRLQEELNEAKRQNAEMKKVATEEKERQDGESQKLKEQLEQAEGSATSAQQDLDTHKSKARRWLSELVWINGEMASKYLLLLCFD